LDTSREVTIERVRIEGNGGIQHILPAEYHSDPVRGQILAYRNYGSDIRERLLSSGFVSVRVLTEEPPTRLGPPRPVVLARKRNGAPLRSRGASFDSFPVQGLGQAQLGSYRFIGHPDQKSNATEKRGFPASSF
jgi:hypothetical protein